MFNILSDCFADLKRGKTLILVDDVIEGKEIGYFYLLSEFVSTASINFMVTHARGLVSVALTKQRAKELDLPLMASNEENVYKSFTVSVDAENGTTGISAYERSQTIHTLIRKSTSPRDLARPGHIFPMVSSEKGVIEKAAIAEAAIDLAKLCGSSSVSGIVCDVLNESGAIANLQELETLALQLNLKILSMKALITHQLKNTKLITRQMDYILPTKFGDFNSIIYTSELDESDLIVIMKDTKTTPLPLRVNIVSGHSIGEAFEAKTLEKIATEGTGIFIYRKLDSKKRKAGLRNPGLFEEWNNILVEHILKDINVTRSVIITSVA
jgi:3,4-dihydroxy 2-butanone 4-phosphate synthase / GTP cyclohydrolase II